MVSDGIRRGRDGSFRVAAIISVTAAALTGCATQPEPCDPRADMSLLEATTSLASGCMAAFVQQQREEIDRLARLHRMSEIETRALETTSAKLAGDVAARQAELDAQEAELAQLRRQVSAAQARSDRTRVTQQALQLEIDALSARLKEARAANQMSAQQVTQLRTEIAARKAAIVAVSKSIVVE